LKLLQIVENTEAILAIELLRRFRRMTSRTMHRHRPSARDRCDVSAGAPVVSLYRDDRPLAGDI